MRKSRVFIFSLVFSLVLHLAVICCCSLQVTARGSPIFYGWFNIVSDRDLFMEEKEAVFPENLNFPADSIRRDYFLTPPFTYPRLFEDRKSSDPGFLIPNIVKIRSDLSEPEEGENHFYLWDRGGTFSSWNTEDVSYRVYVSPRGKILFLYPEKLPVNSGGNLHLQEYIREASFFLDNRFFWTKLEGVVK